MPPKKPFGNPLKYDQPKSLPAGGIEVQALIIGTVYSDRYRDRPLLPYDRNSPSISRNAEEVQNRRANFAKIMAGDLPYDSDKWEAYHTDLTKHPHTAPIEWDRSKGLNSNS